MIEKYNNNDKNELVDSFKEVFTKINIDSVIENNPYTHYYLYKIDNKIVGFINYDIMYERAELIQINVLKEYENNKIGSKLMEYMINDCIKNNVESITLEVKETNLNAIHLYEKMNFKKISIRKKYYDGIDGILMEKEMI